MTFTAEQKSQLAKLLATENLTVEHQKIPTAKFDTKNRVLYLPIWQNMTGILYDLLVGHEVGHALYTPADGWHDVVSDNDKNKNYKNFLNVIEDARIEKKIKRKYPGLNSSFKLAYQELNARDFFGIKTYDVNTLPFIDRLNLFSKSQWTATWVNFSAKEELMIKEVQAAETWEDVLRITEKVYSYSKDEQYEMKLEQYEAIMTEIANGTYEGDYDYEFEDADGDGEEFDGEGNDSDGKQSDADGEESEKQASGQTEGSENVGNDDYETGNNINHDKLSSPGEKDQFDPECSTDKMYRNNESKLLDDSCKPYVYVNIPKPVMKNIVTPAKRVQELMTEFYNNEIRNGCMTKETITKLVNNFKNKNERYVGLLAKEFEMRKAAKSFSKSKLCDTGDIDINKLASYKFDDNIFRKVMMVPKGKNHGLVLLLDRSGSMSRNMAGSIEQILVLSMFCRKVNIPFVVYGFTESNMVKTIDLGINTDEKIREYNREYNKYDGSLSSFTQNVGEMSFDNVQLREYLNSKMTNAEFTNALKNMCVLMESYKEDAYRFMPRPDSEQLNNTPMVQAIVATAEVMKDFKRTNNLDICSLVIVHDGDADGLNRFWIEAKIPNKDTGQEEVKKTYDWYDSKNVYIMRDRANKFETKMDSYRSINTDILNWFTKITGARVFGFFIIPSARGHIKQVLQNRYLNEDGESFWQIKNRVGFIESEEYYKKLLKEFRDEKFLASKIPGYSNFFFIHGGNELSTEDEDDFEVEGKFSARKLATAFAKFNKKRAVNRVLVSRFIQGIAA